MNVTFNPPPKPCSTCGANGVRNLGRRGYCAQHLTVLYRKFEPEIWDGIGIGLPEGPIADDGWTELRCVLCSATWSGAAFMQCPWCERAVIDMRLWQAELVLTAPDVDPDDERYDATFIGWMERLANAVNAGIVTNEQAHLALRRQARTS